MRLGRLVQLVRLVQIVLAVAVGLIGAMPSAHAQQRVDFASLDRPVRLFRNKYGWQRRKNLCQRFKKPGWHGLGTRYTNVVDGSK